MLEDPRDKSRSFKPASAWPVTPVLRIAVLGLLILGCLVILLPFLSALLWATILCLSCFPVYERLLRALGGRRTLAALIMTLSAFLVLLAPFLIIGASLGDDTQRVMSSAHRILASPPPDPPAWVEKLPIIGGKAAATWRHLAADTAQIMAHLRQFVGPVTGWLLNVSAYFLRGLADLALSILLTFFLFRDGPDAANRLTLAGERLAGESAQPLIDLASSTIRGVVYGILGTALAQALLTGIGLAMAGVPGAGFLALLTFFIAITPLGAALVWIPAAAWLYFHGSVGWTIFMVAWGVLISSVDNIIKPMIIKHGSPMPIILILLGVLGGAAAFGVIGIFLGPTLLAVGLRLLQEWTAGLPDHSFKPPIPQASIVDSDPAAPPAVHSTHQG